MSDSALERIKKTEVHLDAVKGCLIGGAAGDALGYAVEFDSEYGIFSSFGEEGITAYDLHRGVAQISDDTQMTLFTANGLLFGDTRMKLRGIGANPASYVAYAYLDWLKTQKSPYVDSADAEGEARRDGKCWLLDVPELFSRRAPGNTCISALEWALSEHTFADSAHPINDSKGCGGVMRVAPLALLYRPGENFFGDIKNLDREGAEIAAVTHSHSLGYMPAAVITHILSRILTHKDSMTLEEIVIEARDTVGGIYAKDRHVKKLTDLIDLAVALSHNSDADLTNIHRLGEGWVGEETMAIAIYCALKYSDDFSKAIITAVNHRGDSDSTGAVAGNIVGAWVGFDAIEEKWKKNLELFDVIVEMAEDLCHGCQMSEYDPYRDPDWETKYLYMHRVKK